MRGIKTRIYGTGEKLRRIYLIAPRHPYNFWSMEGTVKMMGARTLMPNSALATLMALTPDEVNVEYILCDENVSEIDYDIECDLVAVTGATLHAERIKEICLRFRQMGIEVALGGTYPTINSDQCEGLADYHFIGEAEYTWPEFLRQWIDGNAEPAYIQKHYIDMKDSPSPDWSLIRASDYLNISVQTSRGCPNNCDFCDVIQYVGRRYRTKTIEQILREIENAYSIGARTVFFSDDNFLGNKTFTGNLLDEIINWNKTQTRPLSFSTQITMQVSDDDALLEMFADARFSVLFLGVETVNEESLKEVKKLHNLGFDIYERIKKISSYGIVPFLGLIAGFDHDDEGIFESLYDLIDGTYSPIAGISLLNAPRKTALYKRLKRENRLIDNDFSGEWQLYTNIKPRQMSRETLIVLYKSLFKRIYDPRNFTNRFKRWIEGVEYFSDIYINKKFDIKQLNNLYRILSFLIFRADPDLRSVFIQCILYTFKTNPALLRRAFTLLAQYRHFYDFIKMLESK